MHWVDVYCKELLDRGKKHIVQSGTSISGQPHIGSAEDVMIADSISNAVQNKGGNSESIWAMDDMDGLRKVPSQLPPEFEKYIGQPAFMLPCPDACCDSFVQHFTDPFLTSLARINVRPKPISVAEMYREGRYENLVRTALKKADDIKRIFEDISGSKREDDWLPFFPVCGNCGRILTTQAYDFDGTNVSYRCKGGVAGKRFIDGCGHEGESNLRNGKLPWRVEWAARWALFGVTCEPMGKDLTAAGGTFETSSVICKDIFGYEPPVPVPYEWIVVGGKRFSKSAGRILTLDDFVDVATPQVARYFFLRTQPTTHKELDMTKTLLQLVEEYEQVEKAYYGVDMSFPEKEIEDIKRSYELSQISQLQEKLFQVPYRHLISVVQITEDLDGIKTILERSEYMETLTTKQEGELATKVKAVQTWLEKHASEDMLFTVAKELPAVDFTDEEKAFLKDLRDRTASTEWVPGELHDAIYEASKSCEMKTGKCFKTLYKAFLGKDRGPRMGYLLASLERDFVLGRLDDAVR
jgi:lysyl-tRNA synthetase class 1